MHIVPKCFVFRVNSVFLFVAFCKYCHAIFLRRCTYRRSVSNEKCSTLLNWYATRIYWMSCILLLIFSYYLTNEYLVEPLIIFPRERELSRLFYLFLMILDQLVHSMLVNKVTASNHFNMKELRLNEELVDTNIFHLSIFCPNKNT